MAITKQSKTKTGKTTSGSGSAGNKLNVKRQLRRSRPRFTRHRPDRKASLDLRWKKPRGLHNKLKDNKRGCGPKVSDGYRTPQEVRGMHISGLRIVHVARVADMKGLDSKADGIVISSVGSKRQLEILEAAQKAGVRVLNHKTESRIALIKKRFSDKQSSREDARQQTKAKAEKTEASSKKPKKDIADSLSEEEKKDAADKIKQEVLTSKGQ